VANRKIVRVRDGEWVGLAYNDDGWHKPADCLSLGNPTAQEYAELCDQEAEHSNRHDFCGVHAGLLALLRKHVDRIPTLHLMRSIAEAGGLMALREE
jgi:hypothetical protein